MIMGVKFIRCPICGANLDPCEQCSCQQEEEQKILPTKKLFERGRRYKFSKLKFKEQMRIPDEDIEKNWPGWIDGEIVTTENPYRANYGTITILPEWCEEVTDEPESDYEGRTDH
jgi:hypothetical protein